MARRRRWMAVATAILTGVAVGGLVATPASAAPTGYPISGIDVSAFQGAVDWAAVAAGGAKFAYIRASEQANIPDSYFAANYAGAKGNGLFAGAYHRARPDVSTGTAQADFLIDHAQHLNDGRTLPPMLDIEWPRSNWPGLNACYNLTPAQMSSWIREFVARVEVRTGRRAMIYTNPNWWQPCTNGDPSFASYPLFNSGYLPSPPPLPAGWTTWTLWQYSDSGQLPGDQDVFNGDYGALTRLAGGTYAPIGLRAAVNSRYVTAENAGSAALIANRSGIGPWEQFEQVDAGGGLVALRATVNGRFVTAENAGNSPLIANRTAVGPWERFTVVDNSDGSISLRAEVNGRYVTAENAGSSPLIANRTSIGPWERFHRA
jgi:GH25 family lysozyme M1 (1,4-beta-N-acetylmuramidase)